MISLSCVLILYVYCQRVVTVLQKCFSTKVCRIYYENAKNEMYRLLQASASEADFVYVLVNCLVPEHFTVTFIDNL